MDKELARELARMADNLCDSDFSALSLGIGLGSGQRIPAPKMNKLPKNLPSGASFSQVSTARIHPAFDRLPPLPKEPPPVRTSFLAQMVFYFFALIADLTLVVATFLAVSVFLFIYADTKHSLRDLLLQVVQKELGTRFYVSAFLGVTALVYVFYFVLFRFLIGSTPGEWAFELREKKRT